MHHLWHRLLLHGALAPQMCMPPPQRRAPLTPTPPPLVHLPGRLLWGFGGYRITHTGQLLPVAPLQCCGLCVGELLPPGGGPDACADLGRCSRHGVCMMGACQCYQGWGGADCSQLAAPPGGGAVGIPSWAAWLVIGAGLAATLASTCIGRVDWSVAQPGAWLFGVRMVLHVIKGGCGLVCAV